MAEIKIVPANSTHQRDIAIIANQLYPNNFNGNQDDSIENAFEWVSHHYKGDRKFSQYLVAIVNNHVVGYTHSAPTAAGYGVVKIDEWGAIHVEGVRGIGTELIKETEDFWIENHPSDFGRDLSSMLVFTGDPAIRLLSKLGYVPETRMMGLYGSSPMGDEYIFRKDFKTE